MKSLLGLCLVLSMAYFLMLAHPILKADIEARLPLLPLYYINKQLTAEIARVESQGSERPPAYGPVLRDYSTLPSNRDLQALQNLSRPSRNWTLSERVLARVILWNNDLPTDFVAANPVQDILEQLAGLRAKEANAARQRDVLIEKHLIDCLTHHPPRPVSAARNHHQGLPPQVIEAGLAFCGEPVPLERSDVRRRIEYQINYLMNDLRNTTGIWLKRKDRYGKIIDNILRKEGVPEEFCMLPALESGYSCTVTSPSLAKGWWQFVKATAIRSLAVEEHLNWTLRINHHLDERKDLALSTRAATRYLKWMRAKLGNESEQGSWLTTAAAYNAGLDEVRYRTVAYDTRCYWDMKLPLETEHYVPRWIAFCIINRYREFYGLKVPEITPLSFETLEGVQLSKDLPFSFLATVTESSVRFIRELNSAPAKRETCFKATKAEGYPGHTIHVPEGTKKTVLKALRANSYLRNDS